MVYLQHKTFTNNINYPQGVSEVTVVDDAVLYMTYERRGGLHELRLKYNLSYSEAWRQLRPTVEDDLILKQNATGRTLSFEDLTAVDLKNFQFYLNDSVYSLHPLPIDGKDLVTNLTTRAAISQVIVPFK